MAKLLAAYRNDNNDRNRDRLQKYLFAHPMALCMASPEEIAYLQFHEFRI